MPRTTPAMLAPVALILLALAAGGRSEDTVAANVGLHTIVRIAELLSPAECRRLHELLTRPNWDLERPSEENNPLHAHQDPRRDPRRPSGCSQTLQAWLRAAGEVTTWDRLVRELRRIGRRDIAHELGKNLNQDRSLELQRNVEGYGHAPRPPSAMLLPRGRRRGGAREPRDVGDLGDLHFARRPPPPYARSLLGWVGPVLAGVLGGFLTSLLFATAAASSCRWLLHLDAA